MSVYTREQIVAFEAAHGLSLPRRLAAFLQTRGPGKYGDIHIYELDHIYELYASFFDDPTEIFTRYLPFGCNNRTQELWVLDLSGASPTFAKIWHETVPDDWPEEAWHSFAEHQDPEFAAVGI